ncbi:MAG TPA: hypothetical protein EYN85_08455 [Candidatus Lambdaproteobacteria bacterium]|nr:hypothetical protein [Candidatus Lambdaproteobacteria bacterium]
MNSPPAGIALLVQWQAGDDTAQKKLLTLFDAVIEGEFDAVFQESAKSDTVCVTTSLHLMTLTMLNQLYGLNSKEFYKGDPERYVRTTLMTQRLLGIRKLTLGWPVYAFGAEALGRINMPPVLIREILWLTGITGINWKLRILRGKFPELSKQCWLLLQN